MVDPSGERTSPASPCLDATVVICTRNRAGLLAETVEAALAIEYPADRWELLIVDNASSDSTLGLARALRAGRAQHVRALVEPEVGLSAARNAGVRHGRGRIVAFLDDDASPEPRWLAALVEALEAERAQAAGGPVEALFDGPYPPWFSACFLPYLAVWNLGPHPTDLRYNEYPRGVNMAFRREAFERFGFFSRHLGRKLGSLLSCEEIEICLRIERAGGRILYVPGARVRHRVAPARLTPGWLAARFAAQGRSEAIIDWRHAGLRGLAIGLRRAARNALRPEGRLSAADGVLRRCRRSALRGYLGGLLTAPLSVPRYRPAPAVGPLSPWLPSA